MNAFSFEPDLAWSDEGSFMEAVDGQGPHSLFVGVVGIAEEGGVWKGRNLVTIDLLELVGIKERKNEQE